MLIRRKPLALPVDPSARALWMLRHLLQVARDCDFEYYAASQVGDGRLAHLFEELRFRSRRFADEIATAIRAMGGEVDPAIAPTTRSRFHRVWLELRTGLAKDPKHALLRECELFELTTLAHYGRALETEAMPESVRQLMEQHKRQIIADFTQMKEVHAQLGRYAGIHARVGA